MKTIKLFLPFILLFFSCNEIARKITEQAVKESRRSDSIREYMKENPVSATRYEVLERKKSGDDSLYLIRQYYLDGPKFSDTWYKNDERHGECIVYFKSGKTCYSLVYNNNLVWELKESNFPDGTKRKDTLLKNGTGRLKLYHPVSHRPLFDMNMKNGYKNGHYIQWYENGNKHEEADFINDTVYGDYYIWYKTGAIKQQRKTDIDKHTIVIASYFENGGPEEIQTYKNGNLVATKTFNKYGLILEDYALNTEKQMEGVKYAYSDSVLISKGRFREYLKHGVYEYFFLNGKKQAVEMYNMDTMLSEKRWNEDGFPVYETRYVNGREEGVRKEYYKNGQLKLEAVYAAGERNGKYTSYFINGNLYNEGFFENGKPKGEMKFYSREGKFTGTKKY